MTLGSMVCGRPTYVFPATLKRVVRAIIPGNLVEKPDPTHSKVSSMSCFSVFFFWNKDSSIGHFRIACGLFSKARSSAEFLLWKWVSFICKYYSFSYQRFFNWTESKDNLEMEIKLSWMFALKASVLLCYGCMNSLLLLLSYVYERGWRKLSRRIGDADL